MISQISLSLSPSSLLENLRTMARLIGKTLLLRHATVSSGGGGSTTQSRPCVRRMMGQFHRHRSSEAMKGELKEKKDGEEYEVAVKLVKDHIHRILVRKATPDWLPFLPGSSFWVPPPPSSSNVANIIHQFTNQLKPTTTATQPHQTLRGWPSSQRFFIQDNEDVHGGDTGLEVNSPEGMDVTVQVKALTIPENITLSEDEEG